MNETIVSIFFYISIAATLGFPIGWLCGEQVARRKSAESTVQELRERLEGATSKTSQGLQLTQDAPYPQRRPQAYRRCLKRPQKSAPLSPTKSRAASTRSGRSIRCGLRNRCVTKRAVYRIVVRAQKIIIDAGVKADLPLLIGPQ